MKSLIAFSLLLLFTALASVESSATPRVYSFDPHGGRRGSTVEVTLQGEFLSDFEGLFFHGEGIELATHEIVDDNRVRCLFKISSQAPLGTQPIRARTRSGVSHALLFSIGTLVESRECEPNDALDSAQPLRKGTTVNGNNGLEDVDYYSIELQEGESLAVEIEGIRLGENPWDRSLTIFDPEVRFYDPEGNLELFADDTEPLTLDPGFVHTATRTGTYYLSVNDSAFAGFGGDPYRLHVGDFPRPTTLFPFGGQPGETLQVDWVGDSRIESQTVSIPSESPLGFLQILPQLGKEVSPTGFPFLVSDVKTVREIEPNPDTAPHLLKSIPCAIDGRIEPTGDVDNYVFEGKKGESLQFCLIAKHLRLYEQEFGSSLDSRLAVLGPRGEALLWEDDNIGLDSKGVCTIPADGLYRVLVYDHRRRGGPDFPYRLEIRPSEPSLDIELDLDFVAYQPSAAPAYRGTHSLIILRAMREGFEGQVDIQLRDLPAGVTAQIPPLPAGETLIPALITAEKNASLDGRLAIIEASANTGNITVQGGLKHPLHLAVARNYSSLLTKTLDRLAVAVVEEPPYQLEVVPPEIEIPVGSSATLTARVIRSPGFVGPIQVTAPWLPPGVACSSPTLASDEDEIEIEFSAFETAPVGVRKVALVGKHLDDSVASPFFDIRLIEREGVDLPISGLAHTEKAPSMVANMAESESTPAMSDGSPNTDGEVASEIASLASIPPTPPEGTVSFKYEILPILTRFGCNTAACHGRKDEANPFYLTVFGHDPKHDYRVLNGEVSHPRILPGSPEGSLVLQKASGLVPHEGGIVLEPGSEPYSLLRDWIEQGGREDPDDAPTLVHLETRPPSAVLDGSGATRRFALLATFSDGRCVDVSGLGTYSLTDSNCLTVDGTGLATSKGDGETSVLGHYGNLTACAQVICRPEYRELEWPDWPVTGVIDELVIEKLHLLRIPPADLCEDAEFLRRTYLDLIGLLPSVEEARAFLEDSDPDKRAKLADRLISRPEFVDVWATKWSDYLHVRSEDSLDRKAMLRYSEWIRDSLSAGATPSNLATDILSAEGGSFDSPETNFYLSETPPEQFAEDFAQVFLGIRLQCAKCHDHPFDCWTMEDYYSFAAFFGRTFRKSFEDRRRALVYSELGYGEVTHPNTGEVLPPKFLAGNSPETEGLDRRAVLADWVVSATNPWFARNVANRVWEHFFGMGLVSPVDDFRVSNPPTHPRLLDHLANRLVESGYDIKPLIRDIVSSSVYQLSSTPRDPKNADERNYSHFPIRRLDSEVLADALSSVGEQPIKFPYYPLGYRAMEIPNGYSESHFLTVFGRPGRVTVCAEERQRLPTLSQGLALMNGEAVQQMCSRSKGRLARLLDSKRKDKEVLTDLYLAAFSRFPTASETATHQAYLAQTLDRGEAYEDILWALLNSKEFLFQH